MLQLRIAEDPDGRSSASRFLEGVVRTVQYNPVMSWYLIDERNEPNGGSVGRLARMDPLHEVDYVDDFLLEMLMALRLHQV